MFQGCSVFNENLNDWDISSVTSMQAMFRDCAAFNQPLNNWDVSGATSFNSLFQGCTAFNQDISGWNTANVTTLSEAFWEATVFNQAIGSWNTAKVTTFYGALYKTAFTGSLAGWSIEAVTAAQGLAALLTSATMTTTNYDATLNSWAAQTIPAVINQANFGTSKYSSAGAASRTYLVDTEGWAITDGGLA